MAEGKVTMRMRRQNWDRISSLPDVILCHILSFLPTKYSVRTRLLSTRWKYLFAFVPVLDFDYFADNNNSNDDSRRMFIDFVNKMLMMYNIPQMTRFRLVSPYTCSEHLDNVVSWIWSAICRNVQELDISLAFSLSMYVTKKRLPLDLFLCEKLSILKLDGPFDIKLPNRAFLPSLKTLHLRRISFDSKILSICPALEDLSVYACDFGKVLDISLPILRKLRIESCYNYELVLNAPILAYFEYSGPEIEIHGVSVMTSLVKADIFHKNCYIISNDSIAKLVTLVSHVRDFYLSLSIIEAYKDSIKALPTFHNLTRLEVDVSLLVLELLPDILNKCSLLEVLVFPNAWQGFFNEDYDEFDDCDVDMKLYENVPLCVSVHLKEIEFREFRMQEAELKLMDYFLRNAKVLKKIKIQSLSSCEEQLEFTKKLLAFPRFSRECQIVIVD